MDEKILRILDKFYDDPDAVLKNFGSIESFIQFILHKGPEYSDLLDPKNQFFYDANWQDKLIWEKYLNSNDKDEYLRKFIEEFLSDLQVENGRILWIVDNEDLLKLFDNRGRNGTAKDVAERVFSEEGFDYFDFYVDDFYKECVETLNHENLGLLANRISSELEPLSEDDIHQSSFLEELWEVEGQPDKLIINDDNIDALLEDDEATTYIMTHFFPDLKSDMMNSYDNAYNSAYQSELYELVWGEIKDLLGSYGKEVVIPKRHPQGKDLYRREFDITDKFKEFFTKYFSESKNHYNDIEYFGTFSSMLEELMSDGYIERLDFRIPDYPDFRDVEKEYNEYVEIR